jgi:hypothetical protein
MKLPTRHVFSYAAPLLEEKGNAGAGTLVMDRLHPSGVHGARAWARLPSHDYPMNILERQTSQRPYERLAGKKSHFGGNEREMSHTMNNEVVLNTDPHPNIVRPLQ